MRVKNLLLLILIVIGFTACKERNPFINLKPVDKINFDSSYISSTVPAAQEKNVLLEDFTGVQCTFCPRAQKEAEEISTDFPNRIKVIALHVGNLSKPWPKSKFDFRTTEGENIFNMLGVSANLPMGAIDRFLFSGNSSILVTDAQWRGYVNERLGATTPVNIDILHGKYSQSANEIQVAAKITFTEAVNEPLYLTMGVSENGAVDVQTTPNGFDSNYVHNHILRRIIQFYNGVKLGDAFEKGRTYVVSFSTKVPLDMPYKWEPSNLTAFAFVHDRGSSYEVLQVQDADIE